MKAAQIRQPGAIRSVYSKGRARQNTGEPSPLPLTEGKPAGAGRSEAATQKAARMNRAEEQRLISLAIAGDRRAAEAFVRTHQASLYGFLLRMSGRPEVAEDIVQEAFVRALTHLDRFHPRFRLSTWLFTIAKRLYINACERVKPAYDTTVVNPLRGGGAGPEVDTTQDEVGGNLRTALQAALLSLPPDQ